jgi:hypothetical protein
MCCGLGSSAPLILGGETGAIPHPQRHQCGEGARRVQRPCPCPLVLESAQRSLPSRRVVVRKDVTERTETVRDDVRREEVDVQDANRRRS